MEHTAFQRSPIFEVNDITYRYTEKLNALEHINLQIQAGEKLAILGSNGSGKSTLLKILDGLYFPQQGEIKFLGKKINEESLQNESLNFEFRSKVGFVFQDSDVQLFMPSVWEEVAFAPLQMNINHAEVLKRVETALKALNIEKIKDRAPHQLSGGEKKRVALASILSLQPDVWLLDEPTAGLDPRSVNWLIDFINQQSDAGKTIVLATHDLNLVHSATERVYVLDENHHLVAQGNTKEILADKILLKNTNLI